RPDTRAGGLLPGEARVAPIPRVRQTGDERSAPPTPDPWTHLAHSIATKDSAVNAVSYTLSLPAVLPLQVGDDLVRAEQVNPGIRIDQEGDLGVAAQGDQRAVFVRPAGRRVA